MSLDRLPIEFAENTEDRIPVVVVLDTSESMEAKRAGESRSPMEALDGALDKLVAAIKQDPLARKRADVSFLTYGSEVHEPTPFATVDSDGFVLPMLEVSGRTSTNQAVLKALEMVEDRKGEYKAAGVKYYRPLVFVLTDGLATDTEYREEALNTVADAVASKKVTFFAIGIDGADMSELNEFANSSPTGDALQLAGTRFEEFFLWLSASLSSVSQSKPGDAMPAEIPAPTTWAIGV
jgi:von willebrand factor type A